MEQRLSIITLGVLDLQRAVAFYQQGMELQRHPLGGDDVAFFQMGAVILGLYPMDKLAEDAGLPEPADNAFRGVALAYNVRDRAEVDAILARAASCGGCITRPAQDMFWGGYSGYFADTEGNSWEVAWNPAFPIAEDGSVSLPE